uniref:Uncharacterized protein n=1 Tax=Streptomyces sp. NBC_00049 TaxID=2903617 RepID=A0AAU2JZ37_9ACTN
MARRDESDTGKKTPRGTVTGTTKVGSGLGRGKSDKTQPSTSRTAAKNLLSSPGETARKAAPVRNRNVTIAVGKTSTKKRPKKINKRDAAALEAKTSYKARLEAALAHHKRPITADEARRMNEIIKADRPTPELRPRRR